MEVTVTIFVISIVLIFIGLIIESEELAASGFVGVIITFIIICTLDVTQTENNKAVHTYQVRELERNTVFNITDSIGGFSAKDTVYINMSKLTIDPKDSVAMIGVIVKEIK